MKRAMTQIKLWLTNNVGMKIIAVLIAALVWLAVVNVRDPEKTIIIYNIPITITNEEAITDQEMVYEVTSAQYVNVTVSGQRSIVSNLSADDFKATASLEELSKVNAVPIEIVAKRSSVARKITIAKQSLQTITVSIEKIEKQDFPIEVELSGDTADGYIAGDYSASKNKVSITAPTSVLDRIARVVAVCSLDSSNSDISQKCTLELYDKHGNVVKRNHTKLSVKSVNVSVEVLKEKEIPISLKDVGSPANGYQVTNVVLSKDSVKIFGRDSIINEIESLNIDEAIDISDKKEEATIEVDLTKYLPKGAGINGKSTIKVTIMIERLQTKSYQINTSDIAVNNLKDGATVKFSEKTIEVILQGENAVMDQITAENISASIDLKSYEKGTVKVPVTVIVPAGAELVKQINVKVKINS